MSGKRAVFLDPAAITRAINEVDQQARLEGVAIALAGGAALQLYGSQRLTVDVDFLASDAMVLPEVNGVLSFGGIQGHTASGVPVDLIVRSDDYAEVYAAALEYAPHNAAAGLPVVQAEHMVALKLSAGRAKDLADLEWLLLDAEIDYDRARAFVKEYLGAYAGRELDRARDYMVFERSRRGGK